MNAIAQAVIALTPSLGSSRSLAEYERARAAHPSLAPHASLDAVLAALALSSALSFAKRDEIVLALITEHQRSGHPLWQTLLIIAYAPMLHTIARRTLGGLRADARQGALAAFLEAIAKHRIDAPPKLLSLTLRYATERGAFGASTFIEEAQTVTLAQARHETDQCDAAAIVEREDQLCKVLAELVDLFGNDADAHEIMDVLVVARHGRAPLQGYVDTAHAGLTRGKRAKMFARLQGMRARALARLEDTFGADLAEESEIRVA